MEELVLAAQCPDLGLHAVGKHQESVVMEQERNSVQVVGVVFYIGILHVHVVALKLHKQQRKPVHKADDIRPATVGVAVDLQFFNCQEVVVAGIVEIDHLRFPCFVLPVRLLHRDRDPVPNQEVFLLVNLQK